MAEKFLAPYSGKNILFSHMEKCNTNPDSFKQHTHALCELILIKKEKCHTPQEADNTN